MALTHSGPRKRGRQSSRPGVIRHHAAAPVVAPQPSLGDAVARTVADAQGMGRDLARGTVRLAYDLGTVLTMAARALINGTVEAAETIARSAPSAGRGSSTVSVRKPLARATRRAGRSRSTSAA